MQWSSGVGREHVAISFLQSVRLPGGWCLFVLREKSIADSSWLICYKRKVPIADKPDEQAPN
jgi:hypothetical protein